MIREVKPDDLNELVDLLHQLSPPDDQLATAEHLEHILTHIIEDPYHYIYVYVDDNTVVGTGTLLVQPNLSHGGQPYAHVENVVVDENHRGRGIGKSILEQLLATARDENCYKTVLVCDPNNASFYEKCGFWETGEVEMRTA